MSALKKIYDDSCQVNNANSNFFSIWKEDLNNIKNLYASRNKNDKKINGYTLCLFIQVYAKLFAKPGRNKIFKPTLGELSQFFSISKNSIRSVLEIMHQEKLITFQRINNLWAVTCSKGFPNSSNAKGSKGFLKISRQAMALFETDRGEGLTANDFMIYLDFLEKADYFKNLDEIFVSYIKKSEELSLSRKVIRHTYQKLVSLKLLEQKSIPRVNGSKCNSFILNKTNSCKETSQSPVNGSVKSEDFRQKTHNIRTTYLIKNNNHKKQESRGEVETKNSPPESKKEEMIFEDKKLTSDVKKVLKRNNEPEELAEDLVEYLKKEKPIHTCPSKGKVKNLAGTLEKDLKSDLKIFYYRFKEWNNAKINREDKEFYSTDAGKNAYEEILSIVSEIDHQETDNSSEINETTNNSIKYMFKVPVNMRSKKVSKRPLF